MKTVHSASFVAAAKNCQQSLFAMAFGRLAGINHVHRFSGSLRIREQNLATHSYWTALISGVLFQAELEYTVLQSKSTFSFQLGNVLQAALIHDVDEVISGDMLHTFKHNVMTKDVMQQVNTLVQKLTHKDLFIDFPYLQDFFHAAYRQSHDNVHVNFLVKMGDWVQLLQYVYEEISLGNKTMLPKLKRGINLIQQMCLDYELVEDGTDERLVFVPEVMRQFCSAFKKHVETEMKLKL
jgi:5'-deoxynucleotidase YfbR-like HD superfamily hydrolase